VAAGSQFHPPSGHCQAIRDPARERTRGSAARPSRQQAARAFPSMEAWARASPPMRGHLGAGQHLAGVFICLFTEDVAAGHQPDGRLIAVQQPGHGGVRPRIHALPSQAALARLTMRRRRGSRVWRFRQAM
jgi:hypothetical protein